MSQAATETDWLRGQEAVISGRLASMSRADAARLVQAQGGRIAARVTHQTAFLIVGEPLDREGRLAAGLQKVRQLHSGGHSIAILSEEEFLTRLGLASHDSVHRLYTTAAVCHILRISPQRMRAWLRVGLVRPVETVQGIGYFDYQQVSWAKTLSELARAGARPEQIRRNLEQVQRWLPVEQPLAQLMLLEQDGQLLVRLEDGQLAEPRGQRQFDFGEAAEIPVCEQATGERTAEQWFTHGCELEALQQWGEAAEAYRQALLVGGPDARICFNLGNVLYALDQKERAVKRYRQSVEIDPTFAEAWNNLGNALAELGQPEAAVAAYRNVLRLAPGFGDVHYNLADALEELGRVVEARTHWQAYLQQDSSSRWAAYARKRLRG